MLVVLVVATRGARAANSSERLLSANSERSVLDSSCNPVVSHHRTTARLLHCGNPNCTAGNSVEGIPWIGEGQTSLATDASGNPLFSFHALNPPGDELGAEDATCEQTPGVETLF
jgi:hypothetical protein